MVYQFGIGNNIARNKYIPNDNVKSSANSILTESYRGLHNLFWCLPDYCLCKSVGQVQHFGEKGYSPILMPILPITIEV